MFVYWYSGDVTEVSEATSVVLTPETVLLYAAGKLIARFKRTEVAFCSRLRVAPYFC